MYHLLSLLSVIAGDLNLTDLHVARRPLAFAHSHASPADGIKIDDTIALPFLECTRKSCICRKTPANETFYENVNTNDQRKN